MVPLLCHGTFHVPTPPNVQSPFCPLPDPCLPEATSIQSSKATLRDTGPQEQGWDIMWMELETVRKEMIVLKTGGNQSWEKGPRAQVDPEVTVPRKVALVLSPSPVVCGYSSSDRICLQLSWGTSWLQTLALLLISCVTLGDTCPTRQSLCHFCVTGAEALSFP